MSRTEVARFRSQLTEFARVRELTGDWSPASFQSFLDEIEVDTEGVSEGDLREFAKMALSDLDLDDAAEAVLKHVFGHAMSPGVRQNLVPDLEDDRAWEDFADIHKHAGIFTTLVLLADAFPTRYATPHAVRAVLDIHALDRHGAAALAKAEPELLVRIIAGGMDHRAMLNRLFADALRGGPFPEASGVLWRVDVRPLDPAGGRSFTAELQSAAQWLDPLEDAGEWEVAVPVIAAGPPGPAGSPAPESASRPDRDRD